MRKGLKILGSLVGALLLAMLVVGAVFAQGPVEDGDGVRDLDGTGYGRGVGSGYGFVDEDGDGVNDRYASDPEFVDEDGDGICDVCGGASGQGYAQEKEYGRGSGYGFIDEDGDGVNDRYGSDPEFVDTDGDGVCDTHGVAPGDGTGQSYGRGLRVDENAQGTAMIGRGGLGRRAAEK
jgi:hypothetical protein